MLQDAEQWCPNAEKVFVSPTGQVVDPETVQQEHVAQAGPDQLQTAGAALWPLLSANELAAIT